MTIKHLVISGGGPTMFKSLGAFQHLEESGFLKISDIESIYGASAGALTSVFICLMKDYDWETINNYILNRPWHESIKVNIGTILNAYTKRGILDRSVWEIMFKPLFDAKDISMNITLKEFYEYSNIELYMYSFELNCFTTQEISYKTFPELPLLTAIQMTTAIPIVFSPVCMDRNCFIDGGVTSNYPLHYCLNNVKKKDEILGFKNSYGNETAAKQEINDDSTLLDYINVFLHKLLFNIATDDKQDDLPHEIIYPAQYVSIKYLQEVLSCVEKRKELLEVGKKAGEEFMKLKLQSQSQSQSQSQLKDSV